MFTFLHVNRYLLLVFFFIYVCYLTVGWKDGGANQLCRFQVASLELRDDRMTADIQTTVNVSPSHDFTSQSDFNDDFSLM